ncbi:MAG: folate family ECF transporter S component [Clostridia bacterium]|nr:folate family ECF transporter S component [Clostridia bacterium]
MKKNLSVKILAYGAVLIAINIVITRLLGYNVGPVRISFTFLPLALGSILFGPFLGAVFALIADVLGQLITGGRPWLGFCISTVLYGVSFGAFLYKKPKTWIRISVCVILQQVFIDALLGSFWFYHYMGTPFIGALTMRGLDALVMIPVEIIVIKYMLKFIGERIKV